MGLSDDAIDETAELRVALNVTDRIADTLNFEVTDAAGFKRSARSRLTCG